MPAALFRCDGNPSIGMGHLVRCRALASAFESLGWSNWFAVSQETASGFADLNAMVVPGGNDGAAAVSAAAIAKGVDCLVVDHYSLDARFEDIVAKAVPIIVAVDDLADRSHRCDLIVDANPRRQTSDYGPHVTSGTGFLLGSRYALLRPEFQKQRYARGEIPRRRPERLVIALGGADPGNVSGRVLEILPLLHHLAMKTTLVIGRANINRSELTARATCFEVEIAFDPPNLVALMADADIAIAGGGITALEFACLGIPALAIVIAENQRAIAHAVGDAGAARVLDGTDRLDPQLVARAVTLIAEDWNLRKHMSAAGRKLVDGKGAARVAEEVAKLLAARKLETCP